MKNLLELKKDDIVISDWLSPDEKYCIFLDELYDVKNKKKLGDIWENFDNFKFFIRYSTSKSSLPNEIKESIFETLNKNLITESSKKNILENKILFQKILNENFFGEFVDWAKEQGKSSVEGFKEFLSTVKGGVSDYYEKIGNLEFKEAFNIISKGILYLAKKIRDALYHPVGLVLDAILVATGVGKALQWIPWAIVVALDLYEIATNDYEEPFWLKLLFTLFDAVGLVTTGAVAKGLRIGLKGITKIDDVAKVAAKNPQVKKIFQRIPEILKNISPKLEGAVKYLSKRFPKGANFIKRMLQKVDVFINKLTKTFGPLFSKTALGTAAMATGTLYGFEKLIASFGGSSTLTDEDINLLANYELEFEDL